MDTEHWVSVYTCSLSVFCQVVSEEAAFWLLDFFCEDLNPDYHTKCMLGAR